MAGAARIPAFFKDKEDSSAFVAAAAACAEQLVDGSANVKAAALLALGRMRLVAWAPQVVTCLYDSDLGVRLAAIQALSDLAAQNEAGALEALCSDESKAVRQAAVAALAKMGEAGAKAAARRFATQVFSPLHSKLKAKFAGSLRQKHWLEHRAGASYSAEDWRVRLAAVVALGDLDQRGYTEHIGALHQDPDQQDFEVRRRACFCEWLDGFRARLAAEKRRATSAQLLVAQAVNGGRLNGAYDKLMDEKS
eukprot:Skav218501  [mRNA]  locus=scaffold3758:99477:112922:+ [translate_table: standard]